MLKKYTSVIGTQGFSVNRKFTKKKKFKGSGSLWLIEDQLSSYSPFKLFFLFRPILSPSPLPPPLTAPPPPVDLSMLQGLLSSHLPICPWLSLEKIPKTKFQNSPTDGSTDRVHGGVGGQGSKQKVPNLSCRKDWGERKREIVILG